MKEWKNNTTIETENGSKMVEGQEINLALQLEKMKVENEGLKKNLEDMKKLMRVITHDLRGPIGTNAELADTFIEYVEDGSASKEELITLLDRIGKNSRGTFKLLEELSTWIQLKDGRLKPEILSLNLTQQVQESVASLLIRAEKKGVDLKNEIPNNIEIKADSNMIQTVIRNLCSNAIKFTPEKGYILISCENINNQIKIYIKDNGVGLSEDKIKILFDGTGITTLGTNGEKGTGFGLPLCKEMVEKMNGSIEVKSDGKGKGSTFIITLPAEN